RFGPLLVSDGIEDSRRRPAAVIYQNRDRPELLLYLADGPFDIGRHRQVAGDRQLGPDLPRDFVQLLLPSAQDRYPRSFLRQRVRARLPQALAGRGYHRYLSVDSQIHSHLMYLSRKATVRSKLSIEFSSREKLWPSFS